jgi:large subunit ribosomal protein L25
MAAIKELAAVTRSGTGKGAARFVRREARVPGVIYGGGEKPEPISVDFKELNKHIYAGRFLTTIFELDVEGRKERVLPRDYQLDVVNDRPIHVDFLRLRAGARVRTAVPIHVVNRDAAPGVKKGGTVNIVRHTLELLAPADNIPEAIEVDLTGMDFHGAVHIDDLKLPEGCRPTQAKGNPTIVTIVPPSTLPEEAKAESDAPATSTAAPAAKAAAPAKGAPAAAAAAPKAAAAAKPAAKK